MYDFVFMEHGRVGIALSLVVLAGGTGTPSARAQEADFAAPTNPLRPKVMLETAALQGRHFVASLENGGVAQLTLHPALQKAVEEALSAHHHPFAAAAVISIPDGRVLALAGYFAVQKFFDHAPAPAALGEWRFRWVALAIGFASDLDRHGPAVPREPALNQTALKWSGNTA